MNPTKNNVQSQQDTNALTIDQALKQAIAHHNAGRLQDAERLYRAILQAQPNHSDANHNLGVLAVQVKQPALALPHFQIALEANKNQLQYWLSFIDALIQTGQTAAARQILDQAQQRELHGDAVKALAERLDTLEHPATVQASDLDSVSHIKLMKSGQTTVKKGRQPKRINSLKRSPLFPSSKSLSQVEKSQLVALFNAGRYPELEVRARLLVEQYPDSGFAWKVLGAALQSQSKDDMFALQRATELLPDDVEAHINLGKALLDRRQFESAVVCYQCALKLKPNVLGGHACLGVAQQNLGRLNDAVASYRRELEINPNSASTHSNLGVALQNLGQLDSAVASLQRALELRPDYVEARYNLGNALKEMGQLNDALICYRQTLELKPDYAQAHNNFGNVLKDLGQFVDAVACYHRALAIKPDYADAHYNLGVVFIEMDLLDEAETCFLRALHLKPDYAEAHSNLGNVITRNDRLDEAIICYRRALQLKPDIANAYSNLLFLFGYHGLLDPDDYLAQARNWEQAYLPVKERQLAYERDLSRRSSAGRRLKVGYVSGDFRQHAISYFIEQLFTSHDRARIEVFAYSAQGKRDAVTERLQNLVDHWIPIAGISDAAIRDRIEADGIDVLIDLSGHTGHNRLGVFAQRAAPVQAHYLGYFASTGLTEMDYWIGDEILTPVGIDKQFSERVWRLPRVWLSYEGKADAPVTAWEPSQNGIVWLGSFNNLGKLTPATLELWAKVLHALPEGKLLLKTRELSNISNCQRILSVMSRHGISPDRIELQSSKATKDWSAHMAYYDRLDIALDPVGGIGGGTTSCDALWMGVPLITREGDRMASRMTASMLNAIARPEWIARSEQEYIDKVVALAKDTGQRKALRCTQRARMASSPLCNAKDLAKSLERAYFEMFEQRLEKWNVRSSVVS